MSKGSRVILTYLSIIFYWYWRDNRIVTTNRFYSDEPLIIFKVVKPPHIKYHLHFMRFYNLIQTIAVWSISCRLDLGSLSSKKWQIMPLKVWFQCSKVRLVFIMDLIYLIIDHLKNTQKRNRILFKNQFNCIDWFQFNMKSNSKCVFQALYIVKSI